MTSEFQALMSDEDFDGLIKLFEEKPGVYDAVYLFRWAFRRGYLKPVKYFVNLCTQRQLQSVFKEALDIYIDMNDENVMYVLVNSIEVLTLDDFDLGRINNRPSEIRSVILCKDAQGGTTKAKKPRKN